MRSGKLKLAGMIGVLAAAAVSATGQSVGGGSASSAGLPAREFTLKDAERLVLTYSKPDFPLPETAEGKKVAEKLEAHVVEFLGGFPWKPFHHTLKGGEIETYFGHPDQVFYALSLALPFLTDQTRERVGKFLAEQLAIRPPYVVEGYDPREGKARKAYEVPDGQRRKEAAQATSAFGVHALYVYSNWAGYWCAPVNLKEHWPRVRERMRGLVENEYVFDATRADADAVDRLNGDLAGLVAFARMADLQQDREAFQRALARIAQVAGLRINLERTGAPILQGANSAKSRSKLGRYYGLSVDVTHGFDEETRKLAADRLRQLRNARDGWWLAKRDRVAGGEDGANSPHFSRALFSAAALIEQTQQQELCKWVDEPWCKGDLFFIEKCAMALGID